MLPCYGWRIECHPPSKELFFSFFLVSWFLGCVVACFVLLCNVALASIGFDVLEDMLFPLVMSDCFSFLLFKLTEQNISEEVFVFSRSRSRRIDGHGYRTEVVEGKKRVIIVMKIRDIWRDIN